MRNAALRISQKQERRSVALLPHTGQRLCCSLHRKYKSAGVYYRFKNPAKQPMLGPTWSEFKVQNRFSRDGSQSSLRACLLKGVAGVAKMY